MIIIEYTTTNILSLAAKFYTRTFTTQELLATLFADALKPGINFTIRAIGIFTLSAELHTPNGAPESAVLLPAESEIDLVTFVTKHTTRAFKLSHLIASLPQTKEIRDFLFVGPHPRKHTRLVPPTNPQLN